MSKCIYCDYDYDYGDREPTINPEFLKSVEAERDALRIEYESRAHWIAEMNAILGYDNSDGKHSEPDPFEIATELKRLAVIGKSWETDSSLAKWFPFTFEELRAVVDAIDRYISAAGYNEHTIILTKARADIVNSNFPRSNSPTANTPQ